MKIEFDYQIYLLQKYGGISRYYNELIKGIGLISRNENIEIVSNYQNLKPSQNIILNKVFFLYNKINFNFFSNNNADILHKSYYFDNFKKKNRYKFEILTVFDCIHEKNLSNLSTKKNNFILKNKSFAIKQADHLICISENTKKDLINYYDCKEDKVSVTYLGVSDYFFNNNDSKFNDSLKKQIPKKFILFVGNRHSYKNAEVLIKSFAKLVNAHNDLFLIFFGGNKFSNSEIENIRKINLDFNKIIHLEGNDEILKYLYQNALVFVYPSKYEGFGLPPIEAMASNCPVITTAYGSLKEVCGDASLYFEPDDSQQLTKLISDLIISPSIREKYIKIGKQRSKLFTWKNCCIETIKIYKSLIN